LCNTRRSKRRRRRRRRRRKKTKCKTVECVESHFAVALFAHPVPDGM
jgi:hypothetical protein